MNETAKEVMSMFRELIEKAGMTAKDALPYVCNSIFYQGLFGVIGMMIAWIILCSGEVLILRHCFLGAKNSREVEADPYYTGAGVSLIVFAVGTAVIVDFAANFLSMCAAPMGYVVRSMVGL